MSGRRDPAFSHLRREYRALVPAARRRRHLVLLRQEAVRLEGWVSDRHLVSVQAVVRLEDRAALAPLVERLRGNKVPDQALRLVETEDGVFDLDVLWGTGRRWES